MKKKLTLQQKLDRKKAKQPNKFLFWLYHFIVKHFLSKKYNVTFNKIDQIKDCEGPCFLIFNHLSRLDHLFVVQSAYPRRYNMLAGYNEFFRSHLKLPMTISRSIPKKNFDTDVAGIKKISTIIKQGGCVAFSPEGISSVSGHSQAIVETTGHFLKHYNVPVYMVKIKGAFLTQHKVCLDERLGKIQVDTFKLFTPEQLQSMTDQEVNDRINEEFKHDDYEWNKEVKVKWKHDGNLCSHMHDLLYKCPKCGAELQMIGEGCQIRCKACGNGATLDDYYNLIPFNKDCVIPESPSKWFDWERIQIIKQIREDENFSYSAEVTMGYQPPDRVVKKKKTSEFCGRGTLTVDHNGLHYKGDRLGEPWSFTLSYKVIHTIVMITDATLFSFYVNGQYYDFTPDLPVAGKLLHLVEEMHRLHVNSWKCLPWERYMYEDIENPKQLAE